nr:MAG TPA: hypothetical protein [Caudoviricetes sp.]
MARRSRTGAHAPSQKTVIKTHGNQDHTNPGGYP